MRIRLPFAIAFLILLLLSSSLGLLPHASLPTSRLPQPNIPQSDKALHFLSFALLTFTFYFILDTSRRRLVNLTLLIVTAGLGLGSEVLQGALPNGRTFDPWDVLANVLGSLAALGGASWYHRRMLERRRRAKYDGLSGGGAGGEDVGLVDGEGEDLELGEGPSHAHTSPHVNGNIDTPSSSGIPDGQESGVVSTLPAPGIAVAAPVAINGNAALQNPKQQNPKSKSVEEEVDNWDEHAEDDDAWDEDDADLRPADGRGAKKAALD